METLRIPHGVWGWKGTVLVLLLLLTPTLAVLQLVPEGRALPTVSAVRDAVVAVGTLTAAVAFYLHSRVAGTDETVGFALALSVGSVPSLALAAYEFGHPDATHGQRGWVLAFRLATLALMVLLVVLPARWHRRFDALALGLLTGLVVAVARDVVVHRVSPLRPFSGMGLVSGLVLCALAGVFAAVVLGRDGLPPWLRARTALAVGLLGVSTAVDPAAQRHGWVAVPSLALALAGTVLLAGTAAACLHEALIEERSRVTDLQAELARMEGDVRQDRARLHEIDSTVAGIASASRLIRNNPGLTEGRREVLTGMMAAEAERLHRMLAAHTAEGLRGIDLDDVVGRIVVAHRARGHRVAWGPTGRRVLARADDVAEIVDVLLQNAADHGSPEWIEVGATMRGGFVELSVTDDGPGVPASVRGRLFDWGVRGPGSPGTGIGLHVARDLARGLGGDLVVDEGRRARNGARFVLRLLAEPPRIGEEVAGPGTAIPTS